MSLLSRGLTCHPPSQKIACLKKIAKSGRATNNNNYTLHSLAYGTYMKTLSCQSNYDNGDPKRNRTKNILFHPSKRFMSDNLLGYSPMAPKPQSISKNTKNNKETTEDSKPQGPIIGVDSNTAGGGVWSQSSAKMNKLSELKLELKFDLGQRTLDDVATEEEKYDLFLVDGVNAVAKMIDCGGVDGELNLNKDQNEVLKKVQEMMNDFKHSTSSSTNTNVEQIEITKQQFDKHLSILIEYVKEQREKHPAAPNIYSSSDQSESDDNVVSPSGLLHIRDFLLYSPLNPEDPIPSKLQEEMLSPISTAFQICFQYFQITLLQTALQHLSTQWDVLTTTSSGDQDRAATRGQTLTPIETLNIDKLHKVLNTFASGSCSDRVRSLWNLMDKDNDGMLDQEEMDKVVYMSIKPVEDAMKLFIEDSVNVWPLRKWGLPPPCLETSDELKNKNKKSGIYKRWKEGRLERKTKRTLLKLLNKTMKNHFDVEVEIAHRLRCIYAWAEKSHQDGKAESVLIDSSNGESSGGFLGGSKKRYVELDPKISYPEFNVQQLEHFSHLDRVGQEITKSFKEELWVHQGQGRQNQELKREIAAFLVVVSVIDYFITMN